MHWADVIKRSKRGKPRKRVPYNPFTGEGDKPVNIEDRMKARKEKEKERDKKVAESFKKVPRARVSIKLGGGAKGSSDLARKRIARSQNRTDEEAINLNPKSRCAMCGIKLSDKQQTKTANNAADLTYCSACSRTIEGKPVASYRTNSQGDWMPADDWKKRSPKGGRRGFK